MAKGKCFIDKKACSDKCVLYRKGFRQYDGESKPVAFEECAINIAVDCLENLVSRNIGLQKEMNQVRNATEAVGNIMAIGLKLSQSRVEDTEMKVIE